MATIEPVCADTDVAKKAFYRTIIDRGVRSPIPHAVLVIGAPGTDRVSSLRAAVAEAMRNFTPLNAVVVFHRGRLEPMCGDFGPDIIVFVRDSVDDFARALLRDNPSMPVALFASSPPPNSGS